MIVGVPKGLLYYEYYPFIDSFFGELGVDVIKSPDTNKKILDEGVKYCVDEACLPVKVFHGHTAYLLDKCDYVLIPRLMSIYEREFICPKFCGLPEMVSCSMPVNILSDKPIYVFDNRKLFKFALSIGRKVKKSEIEIKRAFNCAINAQRSKTRGIWDTGYKYNVAVLGHPYNVYDSYVNMNIIKKLNKHNVGVVTYGGISEDLINNELNDLFKRPFWTFARWEYGFSSILYKRNLVRGMIYLSSFACGIDSVVIELIKNKIGDFPFLVLKLDEHTGEAGVDTRIEAFVDMLERRIENESYSAPNGECIHSL